MKIPNFRPLSSPEGLKCQGGRVEQHKQHGPGPVANAKEAPEQAKLRQACQDFESIFLNYMLTKMRESVPKSDLLGSSRGEELYRGMLDEETAKQMAASGGVGIAETLFRQVSAQFAAQRSTPVEGPAEE